MGLAGGAYAADFSALGMSASEIAADFSDKGIVLPAATAASPDRGPVGIGSFEAAQILVAGFMDHVGWNGETMYEETGLTIKSLLLKLVRTDKEARIWLEDVNKYFGSAEFQNQTAQQKQKDIFEAKMYAKQWIHELGLEGSAIIPLTAREEVTKGYGAVENLPSKAVSQVMTLNIKAKDGIQLSAKGVYVTSSVSLFCTHTSFPDWSMQHLPNVVEKDIAVAVSGDANRINVDKVLNDNCRSYLRGLIIFAAHARIMPEYSRIDVLQNDADQGNAVQKVVFRKFESPYIGTFYSSGDANILVGPNGVANAEVSLQK